MNGYALTATDGKPILKTSQALARLLRLSTDRIRQLVRAGALEPDFWVDDGSGRLAGVFTEQKAEGYRRERFGL